MTLSKEGDEEFEHLVSSEADGMDPDDDDGRDAVNLWDIVEASWPILHKDEGILTRGMMIVEVIDPEGTKDLRILESPEMEAWDIQGFVHHCSSQIDTENLLDMMVNAHVEGEDGETEETEDDDDE